MISLVMIFLFLVNLCLITTETALIKIFDDVLLSMDDKRAELLALLNLSVAFFIRL